MFFWNLKSDLSQQSKILFLFLWKFLVYCFRFWVSHQSFTSSSMFTSQGARAFFQNWGTSSIMLNSSMAENMAVTHVVTQTWSVITRVVHIILLNIPIYKLPFSTVRIARFIRSVKRITLITIYGRYYWVLQKEQLPKQPCSWGPLSEERREPWERSCCHNTNNPQRLEPCF